MKQATQWNTVRNTNMYMAYKSHLLERGRETILFLFLAFKALAYTYDLFLLYQVKPAPEIPPPRDL